MQKVLYEDGVASGSCRWTARKQGCSPTNHQELILPTSWAGRQRAVPEGDDPLGDPEQIDPADSHPWTADPWKLILITNKKDLRNRTRWE